MPGLYPNTPDHRIHYHRDGWTATKVTTTGIVTQLTSTDLSTMNDEDNSNVNVGGGELAYVAFLTPTGELYDVSGYFVAAASSPQPNKWFPGALQTSVDTTNGLDGTWVTRVTPYAVSWNVKPEYRSGIDAVAAATGFKGIRFEQTERGNTHYLAAVHLYGSPTVLKDLKLWHPTLDQRLAPDAFYVGANNGDVAQAGSYDVTFRVKNLDAAQTANSIVVQTEGRAGSTSHATYMTYSQGGAFATSQNIGNLAPSAISSVLTVRVAPPSNAALSLGSPSVIAVPNSWT